MEDGVYIAGRRESVALVTSWRRCDPADPEWRCDRVDSEPVSSCE